MDNYERKTKRLIDAIQTLNSMITNRIRAGKRCAYIVDNNFWIHHYREQRNAVLETLMTHLASK